jgi:hypothetical protein
MLFTDGEEMEVPLPQPSLFNIHSRPWSRSKEELDEQLRLLGFHVQHGAVDQCNDPEKSLILELLFFSFLRYCDVVHHHASITLHVLWNKINFVKNYMIFVLYGFTITSPSFSLF